MDDNALFERLRPLRDALRATIATVIVGQDEPVDRLIEALFTGGHALFVGVPGLAKTLLVQTVAEAAGLQAGRVQFTPDLLPGDVTGSDVLEEDPDSGRRTSRFIPGPIFAQLLLADEVNRTPPRTQAALLQAMAERTVTSGGKTYALPEPFVVLATQNPIEQEGTWALPEAQLDRFLVSVSMTYPTAEQEIAIVHRTMVGEAPRVAQVSSAAEIVELAALIRRIPLNPDVVRDAVALARASRPGSGHPAAARLAWGAGPRASQALAAVARTRAALDGREVADRADLLAVAPSVLRHRVVLSFEAMAAGHTADEVVAHLVETVGKRG